MSTKILKNAPMANSDRGTQLKLQGRIERRAYELWVEGGRLEGSALSHWLQAEREFSAQGHPSAGREVPRTRVRSRAGIKGKIRTQPLVNAFMGRTSAI